MHACNHMTRSGPCAHGVATCGHGSGTHSGRRDSAHRVYARGSAMARRRGPRASPVPGCLSPRNPICVFRRLDLAPLVLDTRRGGLSQITQTERVEIENDTCTHEQRRPIFNLAGSKARLPLCVLYIPIPHSRSFVRTARNARGCGVPFPDAYSGRTRGLASAGARCVGPSSECAWGQSVNSTRHYVQTQRKQHTANRRRHKECWLAPAGAALTKSRQTSIGHVIARSAWRVSSIIQAPSSLAKRRRAVRLRNRPHQAPPGRSDAPRGREQAARLAAPGRDRRRR